VDPSFRVVQLLRFGINSITLKPTNRTQSPMIRILLEAVQAVGHNLLNFNQLRQWLWLRARGAEEGIWLRIGQGRWKFSGSTEGTEGYPCAPAHLMGRDAFGFAEMCVA
jgi:hypothetical protein